MIYLYITLCIFIAFIIFQTIYTIIPLFKNEDKHMHEVLKAYSFSILVPAFNEVKVIRHCILGFHHLDYPEKELIIINDGSIDNTIKLLKKHLRLRPFQRRKSRKKLIHQEIKTIYRSRRFPNIFVIDKVNGGKADALNAGINLSRKEIVITLDADSVLDKNSLREMNIAFQDKTVIACGGNVLISQGFTGKINNYSPTFKIKSIIKYQFLQYLTAFYLHKRAQVSFNAITVIAGAFGAFRRDVLFTINGFRNTVGEDMDITLKLHKKIKENGNQEKIIFAPSAICYTECPSTLKDLFKQRVRWQKAFIDCLLYYRKSYFINFSNRFSLFFLLDQFIIGTLNAFLVLATPIMLFMYDGHFILMLMFGLAAVILFMYQSITTIYVSYLHGIKFSKSDIVRILSFLPVEIFVFRMINLFFVVYGTLTYYHNSQSWNKVDRFGPLGDLKVKAT